MKHLPEDYQPKGYISGFPLEIIAKMIDEQILQGNSRDVTVFENDAGQNKKGGGFDWSLSRQKEEYWQEVIGRRNFSFPDPTEKQVDKVFEDFYNDLMNQSKPITEDLKQPELPVLRVSTAGEYYVEYSAGSDPKIVQEMVFAIESIGAKRRFDEIAKHMYEAKIQEGLL